MFDDYAISPKDNINNTPCNIYIYNTVEYKNTDDKQKVVLYKKKLYFYTYYQGKKYKLVPYKNITRE